jgi:uncharacterized membrane protein (UPF0127 family)
MKSLGIILILLTSGYFLFVSFMNKGSLWSEYRVMAYELEGKKKNLIVAENPDQWEKGLMSVRIPIPGVDGMIFLFPDTQERTFWNKNTFRDLRIYWIRKGKVVNTSELPSIIKSKNVTTVSSEQPVDTVIELY